MTNQPDWEFVANLGDVNPLEHGGHFVQRDRTGVYSPESTILVPPCDDVDMDDPKARWTCYRFVIEPCTYENGILSDNRLHPTSPAWFAKPESERKARPQDTTYLKDIADFCGMTVDALVESFLSPTIQIRAMAWSCVGDYHGFHELDHYPDSLTRAEAEALIARITQ